MIGYIGMKDENGYDLRVILIILDSVSLLFFVLLEVIAILLNKNNTKAMKDALITHSKSKFEYIPATNVKKKQWPKYLMILLCGSLAVVLSFLYDAIFGLFIGGYIPLYAFCTSLFTWVILRIFLKKSMFRHHILALSIMLIGVILILVIFYPLFGKMVEIYFHNSLEVFIGYLVLIILFIPAREVLEKYLLDFFYMRYSEILFYEGIVSVVEAVILITVSMISCLNSTKGFCIIVDQSWKMLKCLFGFFSITTLFSWMYVISHIASNAFRVLLNKNNDPTHRYATEVVALLLYWVVVFFDPNFAFGFVSKGKKGFEAYSMLMPVLLIVACLIYNENVILYFCGLERYTKVEIMKRSDNDLELALQAQDLTMGGINNNDLEYVY